MLTKLKLMLLGPKKRFRYRSAVTGKMVSKAFAKANPATTVRERIVG